MLAAWLANLLVREQRPEIDAFLELGAAMSAHSVSPPLGGSDTARSIVPGGGRARKVASLCQMSALEILGPSPPVASTITSGRSGAAGSPNGKCCRVPNPAATSRSLDESPADLESAAIGVLTRAAAPGS